MRETDHSLRFSGVFLTLLLAVPVQAAQPDNAAAANKALDSVVARLNALDVWFSAAEQQRLRWEKDLQRKDLQVAGVARSAQTASVALAGVEADMRVLETERNQLETRRGDQIQRIGEHVAAAYRMSGQDFIKLLLNQESPAAMERMMRYHRYFTRAGIEALAHYQEILDATANNQLQLQLRVDEATGKRDELNRRQHVLLGERQQRQELIDELSGEAEDKTVQRNRLNSDRERLEQLIAELQRRSVELDGRAFADRRGSLPWPVQGRIVNGFGQSRADGRLIWHGIVVAAEEGTPVNAVFRGRVVFANWLRGFGLLTIIDHGSGYMTLYGHSEVLLKTAGEWVEGGESIAHAGRSGGQQRSGLYFEVRQEGDARDPVGWLANR